jgi:tetratricopeptide (TPR) repeat protein
VRITAQLIKTDDGTHIWSENYDRELTDVFAIQEDIATAIAAALRVPLGLKPGQTLVSNRNIDPDTYQQYLRAKALLRARGRAAIASAAVLLEQIVARDPNYAPAWALLGLTYQLRPNGAPERTEGPVEGFREVVKTNLAKAEAAAKRAIALDPNNADAYQVLANVIGVRGDLVQSFEISQSKVFMVDPDNADALNGIALGLAIAGHTKEALSMRQRLLELEPASENYRVRTALLLWVTGKTDAAIAMVKRLAPGTVGSLSPDLRLDGAVQGRNRCARKPAARHLPGAKPEGRHSSSAHRAGEDRFAAKPAIARCFELGVPVCRRAGAGFGLL